MAYETGLYHDSINGNDANDGLSLANAVKTFARVNAILTADASRYQKYTLFVLNSTVDETLEFPLTQGPTSPFVDFTWIKAVALNSAKLIGTGAVTFGIKTNNVTGVARAGVWLVGFNVTGFQYDISLAQGSNSFRNFGERHILENCYIGNLNISQSLRTALVNTTVKNNLYFDAETDVLAQCTNSDLSTCNIKYNSGTIFVPVWSDKNLIISSSINLGVSLDDYQTLHRLNDYSGKTIELQIEAAQTYGEYTPAGKHPWYFKNNNFANSLVTFTSGSTPVAVTSAAEMRAKALTDGLTLTSDWFEQEGFTAISRDAFGFPTSETSYINDVNIGPYRLGSSATVTDDDFTPNGSFTKVSDYLIRTVTSQSQLVFNIPQIGINRLVRRLVLHSGYITAPTTEVISKIELARTLDGITFEDYEDVTSGLTIIQGVPAYSLIEKYSDGGRVRVTVSGAATSEVALYGATIEYNTETERRGVQSNPIGKAFTGNIVRKCEATNVGLQGLLFYGDTKRVLPDGSGNVETLFNKVNVWGDATQATAANRFGLDALGLISLDGTQFMHIPFAGGQTFTELTVAGFLSLPTLTTPPTSAYFASILDNYNSDEDAGFRLSIRFDDSANIQLYTTAADGTKTENLKSDFISYTDYNSLYANKLTHFAATFKEGSISIFIDGYRLKEKTSSVANIKSHSVDETIYIGKWERENGYFPPGSIIDKLIVFKKALSATEIKKLSKK